MFGVLNKKFCSVGWIYNRPQGNLGTGDRFIILIAVLVPHVHTQAEIQYLTCFKYME